MPSPGRPVRVVALSDTHAPRRWKSCPPAVAARLREADMILHAGDVCTASVLDRGQDRPGHLTPSAPRRHNGANPEQIANPPERLPRMPGMRPRAGDLIAVCVVITTETAIKSGRERRGSVGGGNKSQVPYAIPAFQAARLG